ncbi:hypothetical protein ACHAWF_006726 [Thalassiosira exigua]
METSTTTPYLPIPSPRSYDERRRNALAEPGVGRAARLIRDALRGYQDAPPEGHYDPYQHGDGEFHAAGDLRCRVAVAGARWAVRCRWVAVCASWALFALTFVEPPRWCRDRSDLQIVADAGEDGYDGGYGDCEILFSAHGATADGQDDGAYYPHSGAMKVTTSQSCIVQLSCASLVAIHAIFALAADGFDPRLFFYDGHKRRTHVVRCGAVVGLLASGAFDVASWLDPFSRMVLLGTFTRKLREELRTFIAMVPEMMIPLSMLIVIIIFYAWFGVVIFYQTQEGMTAFPNLLEGMWTLWTCVTTANYPDVMMPSYNEDRGVVLYFVSFMVLSFFYIMNLVLTVAVNKYDGRIEWRRSTRRDLEEKLLSEAFTLLDHRSENFVGRKSVMNVITILYDDIPQMRGLTEENMAAIFNALDKDGSQTISRDEFLEFSSVLLLKLAKEPDYTTFVEAKLPFIYKSGFYRATCKTVRSKRFERGIEVVLVLNALIIAAQDLPMLIGSDSAESSYYGESVYDGVEFLFTIFYVVEVLLKITVNGWKRYIESPQNAFDFIITACVVLATAYIDYYAYNDYNIIQFVVMARVFRLSRLLFAVEQFRLYGIVSLAIIPPATSVLLALLFIAYFFASLGLLLFGGVINRDPNNPTAQALLEAEDFVSAEYWANNWNDMFSGMNVLMNWLIVNNWVTQGIGMEYATGNKWLVRLFFFSFYFVGVIGISNVITSFIINCFFKQLATIETRQGLEGKQEKREAATKSQFSKIKMARRGAILQQLSSTKYIDIDYSERQTERGRSTPTSL